MGCGCKIYDNYYTIEVRIPFNTLKFIEGQTKWNLDHIDGTFKIMNRALG